METALFIARLLLAGIFALAAVAKLTDREGTRWTLEDFGVPDRLAAPLAILLPVAELAAAIALVLPATAWWGAAGSLALLGVFIAGISFNLARGNTPDCNCFGQLEPSPIGWKTLVRNGVFAAIAGFILWQGREDPGPSVSGWLGSLSAAQISILAAALLALVVLAAQWWVIVNLFRQNGRLLVRLDAIEKSLIEKGVIEPEPEEPPDEEEDKGLPLGAPAPDFGLAGLYGETVTLDSLRAPDKPVVLIFTDPDCGPCTSLLPEIGRWQREHSGEMTIALVSKGAAGENRVKTAEHGVERTLLQRDSEVAEAYKVPGTPSALLIDTDGAIGSALFEGPLDIPVLVENLAQGLLPCPDCGEFHDPEPEGMGVGEAAPEIELPDLGGDTVKLSDFRGEETLVLFFSPRCGFCRRMLDDLKEWEENTPESAPKLLVVSTGTVEENEAMGIAAPTLLDEGFGVGRAFGASGTPSAVLVDADGNIASKVAGGASEVLELAKAAR